MFKKLLVVLMGLAAATAFAATAQPRTDDTPKSQAMMDAAGAKKAKPSTKPASAAADKASVAKSDKAKAKADKEAAKAENAKTKAEKKAGKPATMTKPAAAAPAASK